MSRPARRTHDRLAKLVTKNASDADRAWFEAHPDQDTLVRGYIPHEFCPPGHPCADNEARKPDNDLLPHPATLVINIGKGDARLRHPAFTARPITARRPADDFPVLDEKTGSIAPFGPRDNDAYVRNALSHAELVGSFNEDEDNE